MKNQRQQPGDPRSGTDAARLLNHYIFQKEIEKAKKDLEDFQKQKEKEKRPIEDNNKPDSENKDSKDDTQKPNTGEKKKAPEREKKDYEFDKDLNLVPSKTPKDKKEPSANPVIVPGYH